MCGFVGIFTNKNTCSFDMRQELSNMSNQIMHRGPDSSGIWIHRNNHLGFAHRRLAIQDLSLSGHQPMESPDGRYVISFNGEIYNFKELRLDLEKAGCQFRGGSDTEVMITSIEYWGLEKALSLFVGMFAFALWDNKDRKLYLVRDRMGEKPLYYGWNGKVFLFGSELKGLRKFTRWHTEVSRSALSLLLRHNYIPAPYSIYEGIHKLTPGTYLTLSEGSQEGQAKLTEYWSLSSHYINGQLNSLTSSSATIENELKRLITLSIGRQMISDVPIGAFLSGGVDSSLIVSIMQEQSIRPVKTFTIGFNEEEFNEAKHAKEVARHLGTEHNELYVSSNDALDVIPKMTGIYDEPFADSSQIPTYLLAKLAKEQVSVSLSGDGGDEIFCGYTRYFNAVNDWNGNQKKSAHIRKLLSYPIKYIPDALMDAFLTPIVNFGALEKKYSVGEKVKSKIQGWNSESLQAFYRHGVSYWKNPESVVVKGDDPDYILKNKDIGLDIEDNLKKLMYLDGMSYLPDDILVKVDRAMMAHSLEGRIPLLDHNIIEYACRIPATLNVKDNSGKQMLRNILYKYVPKDLVDRPKVGFAVPIAEWLRGPLKPWAEELLGYTRLKDQGYFHAGKIRHKWNEHISLKNDWAFCLWGVLIFQSWLDEENKYRL